MAVCRGGGRAGGEEGRGDGGAGGEGAAGGVTSDTCKLAEPPRAAWRSAFTSMVSSTSEVTIPTSSHCSRSLADASLGKALPKSSPAAARSVMVYDSPCTSIVTTTAPSRVPVDKRRALRAKKESQDTATLQVAATGRLLRVRVGAELSSFSAASVRRSSAPPLQRTSLTIGANAGRSAADHSTRKETTSCMTMSELGIRGGMEPSIALSRRVSLNERSTPTSTLIVIARA